jgi:hypothetical protein
MDNGGSPREQLRERRVVAGEHALGQRILFRADLLSDQDGTTTQRTGSGEALFVEQSANLCR